MGTVVGEKVARSAELAGRLPTRFELRDSHLERAS